LESSKRRTQIIEHAAKLFGDKGYHNTSISDIISAAGVARGTFYLYFPNKRKIFEELVDGLLIRLASCIQNVEVSPDKPSPRDQLLNNIVRVFALLCENSHLLAILLKGAVGLDKEIDDKLQDFYLEIQISIESSLKFGQEIGLVKKCNTKLASLVALGAMKEILQNILHTQTKPLSDSEIYDIAINVLNIFSEGVVLQGATIP
jgi:AcrR family transcriptional regulator